MASWRLYLFHSSRLSECGADVHPATQTTWQLLSMQTLLLLQKNTSYMICCSVVVVVVAVFFLQLYAHILVHVTLLVWWRGKILIMRFAIQFHSRIRTIRVINLLVKELGPNIASSRSNVWHSVIKNAMAKLPLNGSAPIATCSISYRMASHRSLLFLQHIIYKLLL